jgi:hypothetical protein
MQRNITFQSSNIGKDGKEIKKYTGQDKPLNNSSIPITTMDKQLTHQYIHPLPVNNARLKEFIAIQGHKSMDEIVKDEFLPSVFQVRELRDTETSPPQVRLQAAQVFLNKIIGDKIDIQQAKIALDVNKLLDQLTCIKGIVSQPIDITDDNE